MYRPSRGIVFYSKALKWAWFIPIKRIEPALKVCQTRKLLNKTEKHQGKSQPHKMNVQDIKLQQIISKERKPHKCQKKEIMVTIQPLTNYLCSITTSLLHNEVQGHPRFGENFQCPYNSEIQKICFDVDFFHKAEGYRNNPSKMHLRHAIMLISLFTTLLRGIRLGSVSTMPHLFEYGSPHYAQDWIKGS